MIGYKRDGGPNSKVDGWFIQFKKLFSIALLRFAPGSRDAYHSHAFNCFSIILGPGHLHEYFINGKQRIHKPGKFLITKREDVHQVHSIGTTYVLTFRGPWKDRWIDIDENRDIVTLTHNRQEISRVKMG